MNSRHLNSKQVSEELLISLDWDLITLDQKINIKELNSWYDDVSSRLSYLKFNFQESPQYIKQSINDMFITNTNDYQLQRKKHYELLQNSWTLSWPTFRDVPLPPPWAANLDYFTELEEYFDSQGNFIKDFDYTTYKLLPQFLYGAWKDIAELLNYYIFNPRITEHMPGHILDIHTDGYIGRLHIPMTKDNSKFYYGDAWDREYKLEPGNIYIINSRIPHGTSNLGPTKRANIIADLHVDKIMGLIDL
jgi:hypothetical protein